MMHRHFILWLLLSPIFMLGVMGCAHGKPEGGIVKTELKKPDQCGGTHLSSLRIMKTIDISPEDIDPRIVNIYSSLASHSVEKCVISATSTEAGEVYYIKFTITSGGEVAFSQLIDNRLGEQVEKCFEAEMKGVNMNESFVGKIEIGMRVILEEEAL